MIYIFYGNNNIEKNKKRDTTVDALSKNHDIELIEINSISATKELIETYAKSIGLFSPTLCILFNNIFENDEIKDFILDNISMLKDSPNTFLFLEKKLLKDELHLFKKNSKDCVLFENKKLIEKDYGTNVFSLAESFGQKDKKTSWVIYQKLINEDKSAEELAGILFWQVKTMLLVKLSPSIPASVLSLNPFTQKKAEYSAKKFSINELKEIIKNLSLLLTKSRRANVESNIALEQLILKSL